MMKMNRVFIGYDSKIDIAYRVLKYSIEKHAPRPVEIRPIVLAELQRNISFGREFDPLATTEFTYTRFLVPFLCDYKGRTIFMDNDMLCLADINEIFQLDLSNYWLRVRKHDYNPITEVKLDGRPQTRYPRKNWSSFMLLNCEKLTVWSKENVQTKSGAWLHRFEPIPDEYIGEISDEWNVLDHYDENTKLIHYTEGGPWYENHRDHPYGDVWFRYLAEYLQTEEGEALPEHDPWSQVLAEVAGR
ncbi:MAG: glycosyltransferase [Nitrososphaeraceae archaeon]